MDSSGALLTVEQCPTAGIDRIYSAVLLVEGVWGVGTTLDIFVELSLTVLERKHTLKRVGEPGFLRIAWEFPASRSSSCLDPPP